MVALNIRSPETEALPERRSFTEVIEAAERRLMSAANFVDGSMILESRHGAEGVRALDRLLSAARVDGATQPRHGCYFELQPS